MEPSGTGCSRTVPLTWNQALQQLQSHANTSSASSYANCSTADTTTHTTATLLQIKREPCQVSEVTTSNNLIATTSYSGTPAIIKIEQKSPTTTSSSLASISSSMDSASNNTSGGQQNNGKWTFFYCHANFLVANCNPFLLFLPGPFNLHAAGAAIPIGIAVGRQRLQDTTNQSLPQLQPKDLNRFSLGLADLGEFRETHLTGHNYPFATVAAMTRLVRREKPSRIPLRPFIISPSGLPEFNRFALPQINDVLCIRAANELPPRSEKETFKHSIIIIKYHSRRSISSR